MNEMTDLYIDNICFNKFQKLNHTLKWRWFKIYRNVQLIHIIL